MFTYALFIALFFSLKPKNFKLQRSVIQWAKSDPERNKVREYSI